ncbi:hypothetical protein GCM10010243_05140 [Streptomyces matensis]|nr:hypothetical protein GCM10010243_05140 [Streptomyces matensis]
MRQRAPHGEEHHGGAGAFAGGERAQRGQASRDPDQRLPEAGFPRLPEVGFPRLPEAGFPRLPRRGTSRLPGPGFPCLPPSGTRVSLPSTTGARGLPRRETTPP